jgi:uncharacterized protein
MEALMKHSLLQGLTNKTILTVPGLDGSGAGHWQSIWEERLLNCERVDMGDWANPSRNEWVDRLDRAIRSAASPVILVAHSLGCTAVAWWARERWAANLRQPVIGALLVAPPDLERADAPKSIRSFSPTPLGLLPFNSIFVASRNDRYARPDVSQRMARLWGSKLVNLGNAGHINAESGLGSWEDGLRLVSTLVSDKASGPRRTDSVTGLLATRIPPALPDWCWGD